MGRFPETGRGAFCLAGAREEGTPGAWGDRRGLETRVGFGGGVATVTGSKVLKFCRAKGWGGDQPPDKPLHRNQAMAQLGFQQGLTITFEHLLLVEYLTVSCVNQNIQIVTRGGGLDPTCGPTAFPTSPYPPQPTRSWP